VAGAHRGRLGAALGGGAVDPLQGPVDQVSGRFGGRQVIQKAEDLLDPLEAVPDVRGHRDRRGVVGLVEQKIDGATIIVV